MVQELVQETNNAFSGRAPPEKASELSDAPSIVPELGRWRKIA